MARNDQVTRQWHLLRRLEGSAGLTLHQLGDGLPGELPRNLHLQAYLDEFTFRFNRRRTPMAAFQTLLGLASGVHGPTTYDMLYSSESTR